ncbi:hypothetical protein V6N13_148007 [Hibiscus sabdariffa]|uniref:Uncharacterized protein n=1 Tax=Hibiscus sabdariffa TaxID=183260 RepID=A0ABR2TXB9_9ROSI
MKLQQIATRMVIQYGWDPDGSPAVYCSTNVVTALSMGNNHEFEMATKVEKDLERILNENGGLREKEPFFLSHIDYKEPLSSSFLGEGSASGTATFLAVAA